MKRVMFCTELGGNYGHVSGFIKLSQRLRDMGCEVTFILRSLKHASLLGDGVKCLQAPIPRFIPVSRESRSFAGILASIGYLDKAVLRDYLKAWRHLFTTMQADLVVADHAPTALLAAQSLGLDNAAIGSGFVVPPNNFPLFSLDKVSVDDVQAQLLSTVNSVLYELASPPLVSLGDIFANSKRFLCAFPELDHYGFRSDEDYWGALFSDDMGEVFEWPAADVKTLPI